MGYIFERNKHKIYRGMRYVNNDGQHYVIVDVIKRGIYKAINVSDFNYYKENHHTLYNRYRLKYKRVTAKALQGKEVY